MPLFSFSVGEAVLPFHGAEGVKNLAEFSADSGTLRPNMLFQHDYPINIIYEFRVLFTVGE